MAHTDPASRRAYVKRYYQRNSVRLRAYQVEYNTLHRDEVLEKKRAHRRAHRETINATRQQKRVPRRETENTKKREKYQENPGPYLEAVRAYRLKNRAIIRQRDRLRRRANQPQRILKDRLYYAANRETRLAKHRAYMALHPEVNHANGARYRAQKRAAPFNDFTARQWLIMKDLLNHRCVYCDRHMQRLTMDHLTPIISGGSHTLWNILPACSTCNSRKRHGPVLQPVQPFLLLP